MGALNLPICRMRSAQAWSSGQAIQPTVSPSCVIAARQSSQPLFSRVPSAHRSTPARSFQCSPPTLVPQRISPLSPSLLFRDLPTPPCMAENAAKYVDPIGKDVQLDEALVACESHLNQLNDG